MNSIWGAELNYAPDYWPLWLIYAGVIIVLMIAGLVTHALLRRMLAPKTATGEEHRDYLYSLAVRRWHWGNALLFILLLLSGLFGHFSVGPVALMVQVHTWCGFALLAFWIGFVLINATSGNGCHYRVKFSGLISRCLLQTHFYLYGIMKGEPHPFAATAEDKFNPLQQLAYGHHVRTGSTTDHHRVAMSLPAGGRGGAGDAGAAYGVSDCGLTVHLRAYLPVHAG